MNVIIDFLKDLFLIIAAIVFSLFLLAVILSPIWVTIWFGYEIILLLQSLIDKL